MIYEFDFTKAQRRQLWRQSRRDISRLISDMCVEHRYNSLFISQVTGLPEIFIKNLLCARGGLEMGILIRVAHFFGKAIRISLADPEEVIPGFVGKRCSCLAQDPGLSSEEMPHAEQ